MKSIFFKSFLMTALLILLSFLVLGVFFVGLATNFISSERERQLNIHADALTQAGGFYVMGNALYIDPRFGATFNLIGTLADATIIMVNSSGRIVACSEPNCAHLGKMLPADVTQSILSGNTIPSRGLVGLFDDERTSVGRVIAGRNGAVGGYFVLSASAAGQNRLTGGFVRIFMFVALAVMLFACLSAYWASRRMTKPLRLMSIASQRFAQGDFSIRVPVQKKATDEIEELAVAFNAMADALQKAEELRSGFIANVSHELKTPMTTISGFIDGILDGTIPQDKSTEYLRSIRSEVLRLSRLVVSMLNMARLQAGQTAAPRPFDITELLRRTLLSFENAIEKSEIVVVAELPDDAVMVRSDPDAITQVVYNLLDNAIKYGRQGGKLWLSLYKRGGKLLVSVRNEGITIPREDLPYIFERFHKADKSRGVDKASLGLGLYIVKTILGNMKESITVTSANGVTEFVFTLTESKF